ncbi:hypothetical protein Egran_02408 [Elaphomyces granulatus]|uniref:TeaA receptor TeaR n=1 Tax=Elaphomyces granulatus TaxID=519963 RepID=A0A232M0A1_9EURO|nr:hypothetical protein Egran_02408 [Elaphomyces granulatus]
MAGAATATFSTEALAATTGVNGIWELAVPIPQDKPHQGNNDIAPKKQRASNDSNPVFPTSNNRHRNPGGLTQPRNSSQSASGRSSSSQARESTIVGAAIVMESGENPRQSTLTTSKVDTTKHHFGPTNDGQDNWIHRDKLARIESEELQQAAIRFHRQVRTGSKSSSIRGRSHDSHSNGLNGTVVTPPTTVIAADQMEPWPNVQRPQLDSPVLLEDAEPEDPLEVERLNWDLRLPEEVAAELNPVESPEDSGASRLDKTPGLRKNSSRIPVLATTPHHTEREFPIQRRRTRTLGSGDEECVPNAKTRRPSEPAVVGTPEASPDESDTPPNTSRPNSRGTPLQPAPASPVKKTPGKAAPQSATRKSSVPLSTRKPSAQQKPRAPSGGSMTKERPATRGGDNRPTTATPNRVESDPPWLATMYKPDPRLPPDQQILPTHAKRLQQEQWEKQGKTPSTYDREFAPLAIRFDDEPPPREIQGPEKPEPEQESETSTTWPLKAPKSPNPSNRPGTSGTNYSTIPKVQNTPPIGMSAAPQASPQPAAVRDPSQEKENGCGCCIVM